jgi:hypothetical protein
VIFGELRNNLTRFFCFSNANPSFLNICLPQKDGKKRVFYHNHSAIHEIIVIFAATKN